MARKTLKDALGRRIHPYVPELRDLLRREEIDRRTFLRQATLLGVSLPAAWAMTGSLVASVGRAHAQEPRPGGTLRCSMRVQEMTDPATFDFVEKSNVARQIIEYLTLTDADNITRPYLAERWEASDDLRIWTFHLRQGIKWSNGDDFGADDVVFNFRRWIDPQTGSSNAGLFASLPESGIEKVDAHTVRLHLDLPDLAVPENLYNYPTAIVHRRFEEEGGDLSANPVGTGPFELGEFRVGEIAVLRRKAEYWGNVPHIEEIRYVDLGDDPGASIGALVSGQVDMVYEIDIQQLPAYTGIPTAIVHEANTAQTAVARMQMDQEPFTDPRVRKAFTKSLDHARILELAHQGRGQIAENHHVAPIHPEYFQLPPRRQDLDEARRLLVEAGHGDGLELSINVRQAMPWEVNAVLAMKEQVAEIGINLVPNVVPAATFWDNWDKVPFGFTFWTHRPLGVMVLNLGYRSGVAWNESHYSNPEFDAALDEASGVLDPNERSRKMEQVERILQEDSVIAQPLWRSVFSVTTEKVQNYRTHPTLYHQLNDVWLAG